MNLTTPRVIGQLVNVLSRFVNNPVAGVSWQSALMEVNRPALKLLTLFLAQGIKPGFQLVVMYRLYKGGLTFVYISFVTLLGERAAGRLRLQLFSSLLEQDMAFFDKSRTGELVDRLTTDIAEFKHSFKSCISQVHTGINLA